MLEWQVSPFNCPSPCNCERKAAARRLLTHCCSCMYIFSFCCTILCNSKDFKLDTLVVRAFDAAHQTPEARINHEVLHTQQEVIVHATQHCQAVYHESHWATPQSCVAGVALGGGEGIGGSLWGPSVDSVLGIDVVSTWQNNTADWDIVRINATNEPDLFWGMLVSYNPPCRTCVTCSACLASPCFHIITLLLHSKA